MWVNIETPYINLNQKYKPGLLLFLGLLTSIWTSCIFLISIVHFNRLSIIGQNIISTSILCFVVMSSTVSYGLHYSMKEHDPFYILLWIILKIIEIMLMFIAIILLASYYGHALLILPAVVFMIIGTYITTCIWKTYKQLNQLWGDGTTNTNQNTTPKTESWHHIQATYIPVPEKLNAVSIIVLGLMVSFWANCIFNLGIRINFYSLIGGFLMGTYALLALVTTYSFIYGFQKNDPDFVKIWLFQKIGDILAYIIGIVLIIVDRSYYWPFILIGLLLMGLGLYLMHVGWKTYKKMQSIEIPTNPSSNNTNTQNCEDPPTYEQFVNQSNHI